MIVVADASPICYLLLIGYPDVLPALFGRVLIPPAVLSELAAEGAPPLVKAWAGRPAGFPLEL